nr:helix-turn-helix transcriptional regulator [Bacillota bacterium]
LTVFSRISAHGKESQIDDTTEFENLSKRESQVASRLLQGKTYRAIAGELYISENTVKYYVKNIYSKFNIQSRMELIEIMLDKGKGAPL